MGELTGERPTGLRRFVAEVGQSSPLDADGFHDHLHSGRWLGAARLPRLVVELTDAPFSYVLLGAGGAGKTTTLDALARAEDVECLDLAILPLDDLRAALKAAVSRQEPVYLDAVDQFEGSASAPLRMLARELVEVAKVGVRLRLGCRTALWRESFAETLSAMLPGFQQLVLSPLDRATAADIVSREDVDGEAFIHALVAARRGRISASPQRLLAAARYWRTHGQLADGSRAAIAFEVDEFLAEYDDERVVPLSADRARRIAQRLASVSTFTNIKSFAPGPTVDHAASVAGLPSDAEPDEPGSLITPENYRHVLATALFEAAAPGRLAFRHQQYAEYLAASYLLDRRLSVSRVLQLLDVHSNGLLPGARVGVAAWLMALEPDLIPHLVADNVVALIQSGIEVPSDDIRAALVDAVFHHVTDRGLTVEWGLDLSLVIHPALGDQLIGHLEAEDVSDVALWWVARLAMAGECQGLSDRLVSHAKDRSRPAWVRRTLVRTVSHLADRAAVESLRGLLPLGAGEDPACELAGTLVDVLYPGVLGIEQVLPLLESRPSSGESAGTMRLAMRQFSERIPIDDLPAVLTWLGEQPDDHGFNSALDELYVGVVRAAWSHAEQEEMLTALAAVLVSSPQSGRWLLYQHRDDPPPWSGDEHTERRRLLLRAVVRRTSAESCFALFELRLIGSDDALWLLDELPSVLAEEAAVLTPCVSLLLGSPSAEVADRVLSLEATHPAFIDTEWCRRVQSVASSSDDPWRTIASAERTRAQAQEQQIKALLNAREAALSRARTDLEAWWIVVDLLSFDDDTGEASDGRFTHDLTRRPGWGRLTAEQQGWLIERGVQYLGAHQPQVEHWSHKTKINLKEALPDWSGVYLMATLLLHTPDRLAALNDKTWARWIAVIVAAWASGDADDDAVRPQLLRAAPTAARQTAVHHALNQLDKLDATARFVSPYGLYRELMPDLASDVSSRLVEARYSGELAVQLLKLLVERAPAAGRDACRKLAGQENSPLCRHAREHLAHLDPNTTVDALGPEKQSLTQQTSVVSRLNLVGLDDQHLADLAGLLLDAAPYHQDPPPWYGVRDVQLADEIRRVRDAALRQLAERGLPDAINHLHVNRTAYEAAVLRRIERAAHERQADQALTSMTPAALFALLGHGDRRLVRNDADLVAVVLEILDRLQHGITHNGAFRDLWNGNEPKSEDDISDWIRRAVHQTFDQGLIIDRENQVARYKQGGIGTRIDLTATVPTATAPATLARLIIEAKLVNNSSLETSLLDQLDRKYLVPNGLGHGIYLVYWVNPCKRPNGWTDKYARRDDLRDLLAEQATGASPGTRIVPYILDISRPDT